MKSAVQRVKTGVGRSETVLYNVLISDFIHF